MTDRAHGLSGSVTSPCVRNCCLDDHDIYLGCCRSMAEIMNWSAAGNHEREEILLRCRQRRELRDSAWLCVPDFRA